MEEELSAHFEQPAELALPFEAVQKLPWYRNAAVALAGIAAVIAVLAATGTFSREAPIATEATVATVATVGSKAGDARSKRRNYLIFSAAIPRARLAFSS